MSLNKSFNNPTVFIFYSHKDNEHLRPGRRWLERLLVKLKSFNLLQTISLLSDTFLENGHFERDWIDSQLHSAKVIVLLVSPDFLNSKFIRNSEIPIALMNARSAGAMIVPIILRDCLFAETKFKYPDRLSGPDEISLSTFQSVNLPSRPLNIMPEQEQEAVFLRVAEAIERRLRASEDLRSARNPLPVDKQGDNTDSLLTASSLADVLLVWDPEVVDHEDYVTLITALGDLVRSQGGIGIERIGHLGIEIPVSEDILI